MLQCIKTARAMGDGVNDSSSDVYDIAGNPCPVSSGLQERIRSARLELARFVQETTGPHDDKTIVTVIYSPESAVSEHMFSLAWNDVTNKRNRLGVDPLTPWSPLRTPTGRSRRGAFVRLTLRSRICNLTCSGCLCGFRIVLTVYGIA